MLHLVQAGVDKVLDNRPLDIKHIDPEGHKTLTDRIEQGGFEFYRGVVQGLFDAASMLRTSRSWASRHCIAIQLFGAKMPTTSDLRGCSMEVSKLFRRIRGSRSAMERERASDGDSRGKKQ